MDTHLSDPTLTAGPVRIRPFTLADVALIESAADDAQILDRVGPELTSDTARAYVRRQWEMALSGRGFSLTIADSGTDLAMGQVRLLLEDLGRGRGSVDFWVGQDYRGRRSAAHAVIELGRWAFAMLSLARLELYLPEADPAAERTAILAGYQREGVLRGWEVRNGRRSDVVMWSRLPGDPGPPALRGG